MRLYDYAASGNCYKPRLLLALLRRPYERVAVDIFAGDTLTPGFARLNPARETPVLELDDGTVLVESNAILWYLASGTAFLPGDAVGQAQVTRWLIFEQAHVMPGIGSARFSMLTGRTPERIGARVELGRAALERLDDELAAHDFLVGDAVSIADLSVYAYAHKAPDIGLELGEWPNFAAWTQRIEALPGYMDDYAPYPDNARPGRGRSIYD